MGGGRRAGRHGPPEFPHHRARLRLGAALRPPAGDDRRPPTRAPPPQSRRGAFPGPLERQLQHLERCPDARHRARTRHGARRPGPVRVDRRRNSRPRRIDLRRSGRARPALPLRRALRPARLADRRRAAGGRGRRRSRRPDGEADLRRDSGQQEPRRAVDELRTRGRLQPDRRPGRPPRAPPARPHFPGGGCRRPGRADLRGRPSIRGSSPPWRTTRAASRRST